MDHNSSHIQSQSEDYQQIIEKSSQQLPETSDYIEVSSKKKKNKSQLKLKNMHSANAPNNFMVKSTVSTQMKSMDLNRSNGAIDP